MDQPVKTKETSRFWWVTGARHVIISRRALFQIMVIIVGLLVGSIVAERFRLQHNSSRLRDSKGAMKGTNLRLKAEKDDYKNLFKQMAEQLEDWKTGHDHSAEKLKTHMTSFKEMSEALMVGLDDVRTVLEEKEFQLWEKEGLLEYQEERLLDSEDQEVQMALYINLLAQHMLALNLTLPKGLEEQPYYGARTADLDETSLDDQGHSAKMLNNDIETARAAAMNRRRLTRARSLLTKQRRLRHRPSRIFRI